MENKGKIGPIILHFAIKSAVVKVKPFPIIFQDILKVWHWISSIKLIIVLLKWIEQAKAICMKSLVIKVFTST